MGPVMDTAFHNLSYSSASTIIAQDVILHTVVHILTYIWKGCSNSQHSHDPVSQLPWL